MLNSGLYHFSMDEGTGLQITNKGFQFLLQDVNTQVWAFLLQYLNMAEVNIDRWHGMIRLLITRDARSCKWISSKY